MRCFPQGAVVVFDHDLRYLAAGGLGLADVGLSRSMLEGRTIFEVFPPEVASAIEGPYRRALAGDLSQVDVAYQGRIFDQRLSPILDDQGLIIAGFGLTQDVTSSRHSEGALRESEERFRLAFEYAPIGKALVGLDGGYLQVNRALCNITHHSASELQSLNVTDITHPDELKAHADAFTALLNGQAATSTLETRYLVAGGSSVWVNESTTLLRNADGLPIHFITQVIDVSERRRNKVALTKERRKVRRATFKDSLTGLLNRSSLLDTLTTAIARSERDGSDVAVLFCGLDSFKRVNDAGGNAAGDAVLVETARRLRAMVRREDTVARVGSDQFVLIVESPHHPSIPDMQTDQHAILATDRFFALQVAEHARSVIRQPVVVEGIEYGVTASIGIAVAGSSDTDELNLWSADSIVQEADVAMCRAKAMGKNCVELFDSDLRTSMVQRGQVETLLRQALRAREMPIRNDGDRPNLLAAAYQPMFDLDSGRLVGFEALARLSSATGAAIGPDIFIPVAEESGMIHQVGAIMLDLACGQLASWRQQVKGLEKATMAVNLSALQVQRASLRDDVLAVLMLHGLEPSDLVLELTETTLLKATESALEDLNSLREDGVGIAIDDFGTGYASLIYLANLPISVVKVDRSFTAGLPGNRTNLTIVNAVANLAADLNLGCVVEGVETDDQRNALPHGVQIQGWLTGRPQLPETLDLEALGPVR
jgi:diguanylate cyclase (GGDEF)-like protein/PAS domain S-box-containing protein